VLVDSGRIRALIANARCLTSRHGTRATKYGLEYWRQAPEFAFEHVISTSRAPQELGCEISIAVDKLDDLDRYRTSMAAEYLIDAKV